MALPIFYTEHIDSSEYLTLTEDTSHHVVQVLRMKPNDALQLTNGKGHLITGMISDNHKKKCTVKVTSSEFREKNTRQISIGISLLKNANRFEWFLEKATEIGVTEIIPLLCERTEKQHFRYDRMNGIIIAAMLQSQQHWLPVLHQPITFKEAINQSKASVKLIAHCEDQERQTLKNMDATSCQILIGPEGDFSREEIELALHNNYQPVSLGSTRLRTETAGVVAATMLCI